MNFIKLSRRISLGILSCFAAVNSLTADAFAADALTSTPVKLTNNDYFCIEPVDTGIPPYSD